MARGDRSIRASTSAAAPVCLVALVAMALAGVPVRPGFAAAPASLELEVSSGTHGPLPQAARLTYRIRVRNGGAVAAQGVTLEQQLPPGVVPLGSPALGDGSAEGCLVFGQRGSRRRLAVPRELRRRDAPPGRRGRRDGRPDAGRSSDLR